jgi:hypothetical protein
MTLDLRLEIAQGLETLASAQGLSVEDYLQRLVARELPATMVEAVHADHQRLSSEEWEHEFEQWADSFPAAPLIPDEALTRESLYPDRL